MGVSVDLCYSCSGICVKIAFQNFKILLFIPSLILCHLTSCGAACLPRTESSGVVLSRGQWAGDGQAQTTQNGGQRGLRGHPTHETLGWICGSFGVIFNPHGRKTIWCVFMKLTLLSLKTFNSVLLPFLMPKFPFFGGWNGVMDGRILSFRLAFPGKIISSLVQFFGGGDSITGLQNSQTWGPLYKAALCLGGLSPSLDFTLCRGCGYGCVWG